MTPIFIKHRAIKLLSDRELYDNHPDPGRLFALIYQHNNINKSRYIPKWAKHYKGIVDVVYINIYNPYIIIRVIPRFIASTTDNLYEPNIDEVLQLLTYDEVKNKYPEYIV